MSRYISPSLKSSIAKQSNFCCEYCKIPEQFSSLPFHIEHIISLKHGGKSEKENLAYACLHCNYNKGTDIATIKEYPELIRFYHPRKDIWEEHFQLNENGVISDLTDIGKATIKILDINYPNSVERRRILIEKNLL